MSSERPELDRDMVAPNAVGGFFYSRSAGGVLWTRYQGIDVRAVCWRDLSISLTPLITLALFHFLSVTLSRLLSLVLLYGSVL